MATEPLEPITTVSEVGDVPKCKRSYGPHIALSCYIAMELQFTRGVIDDLWPEVFTTCVFGRAKGMCILWLNPFKTKSSFCIVLVCRMILICLARTRIFDFPDKGEMTYVKVCDWRQHARMLNFVSVYVQQTTVNAPHYVGNSWFWCPISLVVHEHFFSKLSVCRPNLYWLMLLVSWSVASWKRPTSKLPWKCTSWVWEPS